MPYSDSLNSLLVIQEKDAAGLCIRGSYPGTIPTTASEFSVGAVVTDTSAKINYINVGTVLIPVWVATSDKGVQIQGGTIATTSTTTEYVMAPCAGQLIDASISALVALATSDTNYITFTITNLGQAGAGSTAILGAVNGNTTKATGGNAIVLNGKTALTLSAVASATLVAKGDRLQITATATGTLANTVTKPVYQLTFAGSSV